ncbi:unnamed protein product [Prunus brigantina]
MPKTARDTIHVTTSCRDCMIPLPPASMLFIFIFFSSTSLSKWKNIGILYILGQQTARNSSLEDRSRVKYLRGHIQSLLAAVRNGSNAKGYFIWSFLDSLELLNGYESSFGLYYIDLDDPDLKRQPKLSAHCLRHLASVPFLPIARLGQPQPQGYVAVPQLMATVPH